VNCAILRSIRTPTALLLAIVTAISILACDKPARSDEVEDFYKGKVVNVVIAFSAGGGYDLYARLLARHMGKYIPGNPTLVPQNMPGAGTLKAAQYIYSVAPKDGTYIGTFSRSLPLSPLFGLPGANFDPRKFVWLGSITRDTILCLSWQASKIKTFQDTLKAEYRVGGEGKSSDPDLYATLIKNVLGSKAKLVTGFPGTADILLAMERGELDGLCGISYSTLKSRHATWLANKQLNLLLQGAMEKDPALPDTPMLVDLAKSDEQREILRLYLAPQTMARPFVASPGIPEARAKALQNAFAMTMKDKDFLAEAEKLQLDVNPILGNKILDILNELYDAPKDVVTKAAAAGGM
jgi:tripartite-type tricarboxylate transporter receptor subunit TctC